MELKLLGQEMLCYSDIKSIFKENAEKAEDILADFMKCVLDGSFEYWITNECADSGKYAKQYEKFAQGIIMEKGNSANVEHIFDELVLFLRNGVGIAIDLSVDNQQRLVQIVNKFIDIPGHPDYEKAKAIKTEFGENVLNEILVKSNGNGLMYAVTSNEELFRMLTRLNTGKHDSIITVSIVNCKKHEEFEINMEIFANICNIVIRGYGEPTVRFACGRVNFLALQNIKCVGFIAIDTNGNAVASQDTKEISEFSEGLCKAKRNNKYGFIDKKGHIVIPFVYDEAQPFTDGKSWVKRDGIYNFINRYGAVIDSLVYDRIGKFADGLAIVKKGDKFGFINTNGEEVISPFYEDARGFSNNVSAVKIDEKWGFVNKDGKEIIPLRYDRVRSFSNGLACVQTTNKWGAVDISGNEVIPLCYDDIYDLTNGMVAVAVSEKWGFVDSNGCSVVPATYDKVWPYENGKAKVKQNGKYDMIDRDGKPFVPCGCDDVCYYENGFARIRKKGKYGFIDANGITVLPVIYDDILDFTDGMAVVTLNYKYGFINTEGKIVVPVFYDDACSFSEGLAAVKTPYMYGYIDISGDMVIPPVYCEAKPFRCGIAEVRDYSSGRGFVCKSGEALFPLRYYGEIDYLTNSLLRAKNEYFAKLVRTGETGAVVFDYDYVYDFSEGLARVRKDDKFGFIDESGEVVIPILYNSASDFSECLAYIGIDGKWGAIDKSGKVIIQIIYTSISAFSEGLACAEKDGKWGFIDKSGEVVVPIIYTSILRKNFFVGLACVEKEGKYGFIDKQGRNTIPCIYDYPPDFSDGVALAIRNKRKYLINKSGMSIAPSNCEPVDFFSASNADGDQEICLGIVKKGDKYAVIDTKGKLLTGFFFYNYKSIAVPGYICVMGGDGQWGLLNLFSGCCDVPYIYEEIERWGYSTTLLKVKKNSYYSATFSMHADLVAVTYGVVLAKNGKELVPPYYDDVDVLSEEGTLFTGIKNNAYTIYRNGKRIGKEGYSYAVYLECGLIKVSIRGKDEKDKYGVIDLNGKEILPIAYDNIDERYDCECNDTVITVMQNGKSGVIDKNGKFIVPLICCSIDTTWIFDNKIFITHSDGKHGLIHRNGKVISAPLYDKVVHMHDNKFTITKDGKIGLFDARRNLIIQPFYDTYSHYKNGTAIVKRDGKFGFLDEDGKGIVAPIYKYVENYSDGLALVNDGYKSGFIDKNGDSVIPLVYDHVNSFRKGTARVYIAGADGYIDETGKWPRWKGGKYGLIDKSGNAIIPLVYDKIDVSCFSEDLMAVCKDKIWGYIDIDENVVVPFSYDECESFHGGAAKVAKNNRWGLIDKKANIVVPLIYEDVIWLGGGVAKVKENDNWYIRDRQGIMTKL